MRGFFVYLILCGWVCPVGAVSAFGDYNSGYLWQSNTIEPAVVTAEKGTSDKPKMASKEQASESATWDPDAYLYKGNQQQGDDVKVPYAPAGSTPYVAKPKQSDSVSSPATWDPDAYLYKGNTQQADDVKVPYALPEDKVSPSVSNTSDAETSVVVSAKSGTATSQQVKQISAVADGVTKQVTSTDVSSGKVSKTAGTSGKQTTVVETVASVKTNMSTKADNHNSVAAQPASVSAPAVVQTPCELGMRGYVIYNGKCITEYEYSENRRAAQAAAQRAASQNIANAAAKINGIKSSFKKTVWKNEEGNFNTSRLVSDSVAGVVLGTAGGLITSSVIKKNQVKNGFEDIKCTIGGQTVAEYGDEFRVGVQ